MTKPLGYYTNYRYGEGLLHHIQEKYGGYLERITVREKLFLIQEIAKDLSNRASGEIRPEIYYVLYDLQEGLSTADKEGMIEALIAQVRSV